MKTIKSKLLVLIGVSLLALLGLGLGVANIYGLGESKVRQDYKFTEPTIKKVLAKSAYCEKAGEVIVCADLYKR